MYESGCCSPWNITGLRVREDDDLKMTLQNSIYRVTAETSNLGFVHDSFPPGAKLGSPRFRRQTSMGSNGNGSNNHSRKVTPTSVSCRDRKSHVPLPRLPFDNYPLTPRKNKNCSFVNNHKTYLRLKGYQINDVYSIRRRRSESDVKSPHISKENVSELKKISVGSSVDLPSVFATEKSPRDRKWQWQTIQEDVWRPQDSRRLHGGDKSLDAFNKHLDRELKVPGHVKSRDVKTLKLGKVLTQAKLRQLLTEDTVSIPNIYYL